MQDSGIVKQVVKIDRTNRQEATHFALCNVSRMRYLIDLHGGKKRLSNNISTYSNKLGLLMRFISVLPFSLLARLKLGYFVVAELHEEVEELRQSTKKNQWNMIIGTYDEKQKVILQCFNRSGNRHGVVDKDDDAAVYMKIGNAATEEEMNTEIFFLQRKNQFTSFDIPELLGSTRRAKGAVFNIQVTKEFTGSKVEPVLVQGIVDIYFELSKDTKDGLAFSHGDFAPWNLKKRNNRFMLFDWEHCGYKMPGFDLMHYCVVPKLMLEGKTLSEAIEEGLCEIREFIPEFSIDKEQFILEYNKLRLEQR